MCNVYSCGAVDLDKAMRETRSSLRTKMAVDGTVIEKPKRRHFFNSIHSHLNSTKHSETENSGRRWFPKLPERKSELRSSRKNTSSSLECIEKDERVLAGSKSTPPTPPAIRSHAQLQASPSVAPDTQLKPPRPPIRSAVPDPPSTIPPPVPISSPPQIYATPIYEDLQKASNPYVNSKNNRIGIVEEHSLRHIDSPKNTSVIRIRTDVDVSQETKNNETSVNVYDSPFINKSHYVNIRPPIAQKPKLIQPDTTPPPKTEKDVTPTFISVECYQSTVPIPSPRTYYHTSDIPSSQRSSSSAYSSNYSTSSSSNVTSFAVDNVTNDPKTVENARYVRIESPDGVLHRF